jgi:hypothetical protein
MNKRFVLIACLLAAVGGLAVVLFRWYVSSDGSAQITEKDIIKARRKLQGSEPLAQPAQAAPVPVPLSRSVRLAIGSLGFADDSQNRQHADLVTAELTGASGLELVERQSLDKVLRELELNLSGLVRAKDAIRAG